MPTQSRYERFTTRLIQYLDTEIEKCKTAAIEGSTATLEGMKGQYIAFIHAKNKIEDLKEQIRKEEKEDYG